MKYESFIERKHTHLEDYGFDVDLSDINPNAFAWQRRVIQWSLRRGRCAEFLDTGLGKTLCQLVWAEHVVRHANKPVLLHCPLGVRWQTAKEANKFGIGVPVVVANSMDDVPADGIAIANYEKLHKFDPEAFAGVVLDESSILKGYTGATKRALCAAWKHSRYKLACTATPSPNDHMELGNHSEFLGVMPSNEMLSRWFFNDTMQAGGYKILPHGENDFWSWVAGWAACVSMPSDIGGDDAGYDLPKLHRIDHLVQVDEAPRPGQLFYTPVKLNATTVHQEKRRTTDDRAAKVAELIQAEPDEPWLIWCNTDYESDALLRAIPDALDIRGSQSEAVKESRLDGFSSGELSKLIAKPSQCGFGMNWQHCRRMAFIGLNYSYEEYYQAVRRCWRFGQQSEVFAHVILTDSEQSIHDTNARKTNQHADMKRSMMKAVKRHSELAQATDLHKAKYEPNQPMEIPSWLKS